MRFGAFIAPFHAVEENPTLTIRRDMRLVEWLEENDFDEAWIGEHHSAGFENISSPELFIAGVAERTKKIRLGTGVNSLSYHQPLILADRIVQLDHQTGGRIIFGAGPGQLPSDAHMLGIDPRNQRRMMNESLECIVDLLEGKTVNRETDWFKLRDARLHVLPYQTPRMEMSVACAVTPTGPTTAGRLGLGMLSLAASTPIGFNALGDHWGVHEEAARKNGLTVSRANWRVVVTMHLSETREQARKDMEYGIMDIVKYVRKVSGKFSDDARVAKVTGPSDVVDLLTSDGIGTFGVALVGTPEDAIAHIEKLQKQSGGFGTFLFLAHNCANFEATKHSYELFARRVMPHFQNSNANRAKSLDWAHANSSTVYEGIVQATQNAIADYEKEKSSAT